MSEQMRLNKFLAERLGVSRRQADDLIAAGKVKVRRRRGGVGAGAWTPAETVVLGARLSEGDEVTCCGEVVPLGVDYVYLGMNKPAGYVCSRKRQGEAPTIFELLPEKYRNLKTVGRLDKDSSGLILLTNDGDFAFQMTHPKFVKTKVYEVELDYDLAPLHQQEIADFGIRLTDGVSRLGLERMEGRRRWRVTMSEGRNRQIRRTFGALGYTVEKLHRTDFGKYHLTGLKPGGWVEVEK